MQVILAPSLKTQSRKRTRVEIRHCRSVDRQRAGTRRGGRPAAHNGPYSVWSELFQ